MGPIHLEPPRDILELCGVTSSPKPETVPVPDSELIRRVRTRKDADAFQMLYARYKRPAFALALFLTRNQHSAEDAVQEAMTVIWRMSSFDEGRGHSARGWVLSIVTKSSLKVLRKNRALARVAQRALQANIFQARTATSLSMERIEILHSLRKQLEHLPLRDRRIVELYFGAGRNQVRIAQDLEIPRRTVAYRLERTLRRLKGNLARFGFPDLSKLEGG